MLMNRIPLVVHHATSFTCASGSGLNNLMDSVVAGHVIGPHTGDFVWTSRECSQIGNVLLRYTGDTFQLIREEPWLRFCNGEEFLSFEEALEMFASGEIVWSGCLGCPGRGVPNCDLAAR